MPEVPDIVQEAGIKSIPKKKKCKEAKATRKRNPPFKPKGLVLSFREEEERRAFMHLGGSYWGTVGCGP